MMGIYFGLVMCDFLIKYLWVVGNCSVFDWVVFFFMGYLVSLLI